MVSRRPVSRRPTKRHDTKRHDEQCEALSWDGEGSNPCRCESREIADLRARLESAEQEYVTQAGLAAQLEQERDEARAKLKHAAKDDEIHWKTRRTLIAERDQAEARVRRVIGERDALQIARDIWERQARRLEEVLRVEGYHAPGECPHGMSRWRGDHCAYDCAALSGCS